MDDNIIPILIVLSMILGFVIFFFLIIYKIVRSKNSYFADDYLSKWDVNKEELDTVIVLEENEKRALRRGVWFFIFLSYSF